MRRVRVVIHTDDLLSALGVAAQLRGQEAIEIVQTPDDPLGVVALVVGWQVDEVLLAQCREAVTGQGLRVALVVARMRQAELLQVIGCGINTVLWRHEATAPRLVAAVIGAQRGEGNIPADLLGHRPAPDR